MSEQLATIQTEKAFLRQTAVSTLPKALQKKKLSKKRLRYFKDVGLGFKTPSAAVTGHYIDKKCPFTGDVSIRGRILRGVVVSNKMKRTIVIRRDYLHYLPKYNRFEKRHRNIPAHLSPAFQAVHEGDIVTIGQCRPLSKTVRFNVVAHEPQAESGAGKKQFRMF
jgi:small subunit ribosomal protein S11e